MALDHLHPFAEQHAIQSAAVSLDFSVELDVGEVMRLRATHEQQLKADFPNITDQQRATVQLTAGQSVPTSIMDLGGFVMERPTNPQVHGAPPLRVIIVSRESIVFVINDYTRWDRFRADVERYMDALLRPINAQKAIANIGLQITDAFIWKADPNEMPLSEILSRDSEFLPANVFLPQASLWHSHHGFLTEKSHPVNYEQLDNVNVSRNAAGGIHQIQILTSHRATFPRPVYKILDANRQKVSSILEELHLTNKRILASILTSGVQEKIKLNYKQG